MEDRKFYAHRMYAERLPAVHASEDFETAQVGTKPWLRWVLGEDKIEYPVDAAELWLRQRERRPKVRLKIKKNKSANPAKSKPKLIL